MCVMNTNTLTESQFPNETFTVPSYADDQAAVAAILRKCGVPAKQIDEFFAAYPCHAAPAG